MRARAVAPLMMKISGLLWRSAISTVAPTARRSCGLGRVGTITRSACATTWEIEAVMAGGVSITGDADAHSVEPGQRLAQIQQPRLDEMRLLFLRAFHQCANEPCGSVSINATGPAPAREASTAI